MTLAYKFELSLVTFFKLITEIQVLRNVNVVPSKRLIGLCVIHRSATTLPPSGSFNVVVERGQHGPNGLQLHRPI